MCAYQLTLYNYQGCLVLHLSIKTIIHSPYIQTHKTNNTYTCTQYTHMYNTHMYNPHIHTHCLKPHILQVFKITSLQLTSKYFY